MQNAPREHSAILLTFIKLPFVFKIFVLSIFEWLLKTGFTVLLSMNRKANPCIYCPAVLSRHFLWHTCYNVNIVIKVKVDVVLVFQK